MLDVIRRWGTAIALGLLVAVAVAATVMVHERVFPAGSPNLDEVAYEAQARAYANGELTLPADRVVPDFTPYLSGRNDAGDVVFKYQPLWPAALAASIATTGGMLAAQLLVAAASVLATAWFSWELLRSARVAVVAATIVALSPITWLLSGTVLGYQLSFALVGTAAAALLRTERVPSLASAVLAGLATGAAFLHRPFDSLIALAPVLAMVAWRGWRDPNGGRTRLFLGVALGALPFVAALAVVNTAVMGAPWRLPFNASGDLDRFGFGWRASFDAPGMGRESQLHYTPGRALSTQGASLLALVPVLFGGPFTVGFALAAVLSCWDRRARLLVAMVATVVVGYTFWWGTANLLLFGLDHSLGPVYHEPLVLPLAVGAAWGFELVLRRWSSGRDRGRVLVGGAVLALITLSFLTVALSRPTFERANDDGNLRRDEVGALTGPAPSLAFQPPTTPGDPYVRVANEPDLSGDRLVAVDDPARRVELAFRFPDRSLVLVEDRKPLGDLFGEARTDRLELRRVEAPSIELVVDTGTGASSMPVWLAIGEHVVPGPVDGPLLVRASDLPEGSTTPVTVFLAPTPDLATSPYRLEWRLERVGDVLRTLDQPRALQHYDFGEGRQAVITTDLGAVLTGRAASGGCC